jgi:hypothetical protein
MQKKLFYELSQDESNGGVAFVPDEYLYEYYEGIKNIDTAPFTLNIEEGYFEDYLANNLGWPLMSLKLKKIFDKYAIGAPKFKWTKAKVLFSVNSELREYYYLISLDKPDVLDSQKTRFVDEDYIYGVFAYEKIKDYTFFPHPSVSNNDLIVCGQIRDEMINAGITGAYLEKADISFAAE